MLQLWGACELWQPFCSMSFNIVLWWPLFCLLLTQLCWALSCCWNTIVTTLNMSLYWESELTWYLLLLLPQGRGCRPVQLREAEAAVAVFFCCVALPQRIALGWCGWKITFLLLSWVLSATFSFTSLPWHACSLDNWRDELYKLHPVMYKILVYWILTINTTLY
jgi:hypothetical protein